MTSVRLAAFVVFVTVTVAATALDIRRRTASLPSGDVLVADLHVHPFPGDGVLTPAQLRREAVRRGIDVIGITAHNNRLALTLDSGLAGGQEKDVIVIPGQEVTSVLFHIVALGLERVIDHRLPLEQAIAEVHRQNGVAIAAHPIPESWKVFDPVALSRLDGAEVAHPVTMNWREGREVVDYMVGVIAKAKPGLAMIGSTDFHTTAPLGRCRTYLLTRDRSEDGVIDAIRRGRTVGADPDGRLFGSPEDVAKVAVFIAARPAAPAPSGVERSLAAAALVALAALALPGRRH